MKPVEIEFIMKDKLSGGMDKIGASATSVGARTAQSSRQITSQLDEVSRGIATSGSVAETEGKKIESMFKSATSAALAYFTVNQAYSFASDIARVRGEFQQLDVAFSTLLQSKEKADILMAQMVDLAARTPFKLTDVATGAKQLVAYGFAAEEINGTLIRLGNIASGLNLPMERLTYLYGTTMTQGRLYARDMMQFTTSGIPMLQGLADMYGITTDKIDEMVTAGKIGFPEVKQVIENMTNEGGKFYNLMELQSKTITGKISNLGDAIDVMYNKMGQSQEGVINSAIDSAKYLVDNYEKVGSIITTLIATYGTYKTAVIVLSAVEKARLAATLSGEVAVCIATRQVTAMQALRYMATMKLKTAQELLNVTMAKNPYLLIGMAVAAVAVGTYNLIKAITQETEAEKALREEQERKLERNNNYLASMSKEQAEVDILFGRLKALTAGTKAYNDTKNDIISKYGQYLKGLGDEIESLQNVEGAYKAISTAAVQAARDRAISEVTSASTGEYAKVEAENLRSIRALLNQTKGALDGERIFTSLKESMRTGTEFSDEVKSAIGYTAEWGRETTVVYDKVMPRMKGIFESLIYGISDSKAKMTTEIKEVEDILGGVFSGNEGATANPPTQLHAIIADIRSQQAELKKLNAQSSWSAQEAKRIGELNESVGELKKQYESFTGKSYDQKQVKDTAGQKSNDSYIKMQEKLREQSDAIYLATWQNRINIQQDGFDKQMEQLELNYSKELLAIEQYTRDQVKLYQDAEREKYKSEHKGSDQGFVATTQTSEDLPKDIQNRIQARRQAASVANINANKKLREDELKSYETFANAYVAKANEFTDNITAIEERTKKQRKTLVDSGASADQISEFDAKAKSTIDGVKGVQEELLAGMDEQMGVKNQTFITFIEGIANMGLETLIQKLTETEGLLESAQLDTSGNNTALIANYKKQISALKTLVASGDKKQPQEEKTNDPLQKYKAALKTVNELGSVAKDISKAFAGLDGDVFEVMDSVGIMASSIGSLLSTIVLMSTTSQATITATTVAAGTGIVVTSTAASTAIQTVEKASVILAIIGAAIQIITAIFSAGSAAAKRHQEALDAVMNAKIEQQREYNLLLLEQNLLYEKGTTVFGTDNYGKAINSINNYKDAMSQLDAIIKGTEAQVQEQKQQNDRSKFFGRIFGVNNPQAALKEEYAGLASLQIVTGHKKTGLFGWGKGKDTYSSVLSVYPELIDKQGKFDASVGRTIVSTRKMSDATKATLEYCIELADQYAEAMQQVRDFLTEIFGELGATMSDALVDAFENGTDAGKAFADSVSAMLEDMAKQMVYSVTIAPLMEEANAKMFAIMDDLSLSDEDKFQKQAALLAEMTKKALAEQQKANDLYQTAKDAAASEGIDIFEPDRTAQSGNAGAFETMTQEQGTKLEGLFTSAQMHLSSIDEKMEYEAVAMHDAANQLSEIAANTAYCKHLKEIKEYIEYMKTNGIKVK